MALYIGARNDARVALEEYIAKANADDESLEAIASYAQAQALLALGGLVQEQNEHLKKIIERNAWNSIVAPNPKKRGPLHKRLWNWIRGDK